MVFSKRSLEGCLTIDHKAGDGMPLDIAHQSGAMPVGRGMTFESATITCSHCGCVVIMNPDRSRSRGYCPKCDHYVCDQCEGIRVASGGECKTLKQVMDELEASVLKKSALII